MIKSTCSAMRLSHSVDTEAWADQYHNIEVGGLQLKPFLLSLGLITPEALDRLHQQALIERSVALPPSA